jgi:hypothetical protein
VNAANLGRLHPDFPMDPSIDRFERKLRSNMDRVKKATDRLDGVVGRYGYDFGGARDAMAELRELMEEVRNGIKDVRPEVAEECARQIRAYEGELARIGARLSGAMPASAITPTRMSAAPADSAGGMFWLPRQTTSQLHSNIDRLSSQPQSPISHPRLLPQFQVAAEVYGATMNWNPPSETRVSSNHDQPGHSSSVASSRQRQVQEEQNQINRRVRELEALIDEEE